MTVFLQMVKEKVCISCGKRILNDNSATSFPCPVCSEVEIVRCGECRKRGVRYICPGCKFEGP